MTEGVSEMLLGGPGLLVVAALAFFWIGMLGLLWRRSLVGMLIGIFFSWISVAVSAIGFSGLSPSTKQPEQGAIFILCIAFVLALQILLGLSIVVARIARRGTLDAQDAELLEG